MRAASFPLIPLLVSFFFFIFVPNVAVAENLVPSVIWLHSNEHPGDATFLEQTLSHDRRLRIVPLRALEPLMRQADTAHSRLETASALVEAGRKSLVELLAYDTAQAQFTQALAAIDEGFVEHYDPAFVANIYVLLGVTHILMARPELAERDFLSALHLQPTLALDSYYSPQVRTVFNKVKAQSPYEARPVPDALHLQTLLTLASAQFAIVIDHTVESDGNTRIAAAMFNATKKTYLKAHTRLLSASLTLDARNAELETLAQVIRDEILALLPPAKTNAHVAVASQPVFSTSTPSSNAKPSPSCRERHWYCKWYVWAIVGGIVGSAIAITVPIVTAEKQVDLVVTW